MPAHIVMRPRIKERGRARKERQAGNSARSPQLIRQRHACTRDACRARTRPGASVQGQYACRRRGARVTRVRTCLSHPFRMLAPPWRCASLEPGDYARGDYTGGGLQCSHLDTTLSVFDKVPTRTKLLSVTCFQTLSVGTYFKTGATRRDKPGPRLRNRLLTACPSRTFPGAHAARDAERDARRVSAGALGCHTRQAHLTFLRRRKRQASGAKHAAWCRPARGVACAPGLPRAPDAPIRSLFLHCRTIRGTVQTRGMVVAQRAAHHARPVASMAQGSTLIRRRWATAAAHRAAVCWARANLRRQPSCAAPASCRPSLLHPAPRAPGPERATAGNVVSSGLDKMRWMRASRALRDICCAARAHTQSHPCHLNSFRDAVARVRLHGKQEAGGRRQEEAGGTRDLCSSCARQNEQVSRQGGSRATYIEQDGS